MKIYKNIDSFVGINHFDDIEICGDENNNFYPVFISKTDKIVYRYAPKDFVPFIRSLNMLTDKFFEKINDNYKKFSYACSLMAENSKEDFLNQHEFNEQCKKILLKRQIKVVCKENINQERI